MKDIYSFLEWIGLVECILANWQMEYIELYLEGNMPDIDLIDKPEPAKRFVKNLLEQFESFS